MFVAVSYATIPVKDINLTTVHPDEDLVKLLRGKFTQHNTDIANAGSNLGTGKVFYVDSNAGGSSTSVGTTPASAVPTIDDAIALCTADRGDVIYVMQGHNEGLSAADGIDADISGITIIGIGNGSLKPTIDFDSVAAECVIGAANIRIENIRFRASSDTTTAAIDIEDAGDDFQVVGCEFGWAETAGTDEFLTSINVKDNVDNGLILGCTFRLGGAGATQAIHVVSSTAGLDIIGNHIQGDYSAGCIKGTVGQFVENVVIKGNTLFNGTMSGDGEINAVAGISFADDSSGLIMDNRIIADLTTALAMRTGDDMVFINNFLTDTDGDEFSGTIESNGATVTATPTG